MIILTSIPLNFILSITFCDISVTFHGLLAIKNQTRNCMELNITQPTNHLQVTQDPLTSSFVSQYETLEFSKNQKIYEQWDNADSIFFLEEGRVILGKQSSDGRTLMKEVIYARNIFGEMAVFDHTDRGGFAKALDKKVVVRRIPKGDFMKMLFNNQLMLSSFFEVLGKRIDKYNNKVEDLQMRDARTRVIHYLVQTADEQGKKVGFEMMIKDPLTHQDIGNLTGVSRQTTTTILNELKGMNLIHIDTRRILIRDLDILREMSKV